MSGVHCACNGNGILSERFQLQEYMYSPATRSCSSLRSASLCQNEIFLSCEAEVQKECAGWSMENLIWTQRPDRSGANEVGFPDGHGDWDGGKMRVRADNIDRLHMRYARIYTGCPRIMGPIFVCGYRGLN